jgi:hypothetical protein
MNPRSVGGKDPRAELKAALEAANKGAPDITEEELVDEILARRERGSDTGSPSL